MESIFFDTSYSNFTQMLIKISAFLLVTVLLLCLVYFVLAKSLFKKARMRKEISLRLALLWTVFAWFILFSVYVFILFYKNGIENFHWTSFAFYPGVLAQLIIYIGLLIYFFIRRNAINKIINEKSTN